jgi:uncharacterized membrane protein YcaP (DUF421 family)
MVWILQEKNVKPECPDFSSVGIVPIPAYFAIAESGANYKWMTEFLATLNRVLGIGLEPQDLSFLHIAVRAVIVFFATLLIVRVSNKRFLSKMSAFDAIVGFILASMLARAVNGSASFWPTLGGGFVLIGIHRLLAFISVRSRWFERVVKGSSENLVHGGRVNRKLMRKLQISESDLLEEARLNAQVSELDEIKSANLERSGEISVIPDENGKS